MGWFFRKSLRVLPGVRINLSKHGPSLSVGVPGFRASVNTQGKARLNGGVGPLRYQKSVAIDSSRKPQAPKRGLLTWVKRMFIAE
jgi:hypothetical protein